MSSDDEFGDEDATANSSSFIELTVSTARIQIDADSLTETFTGLKSKVSRIFINGADFDPEFAGFDVLLEYLNNNDTTRMSLHLTGCSFKSEAQLSILNRLAEFNWETFELFKCTIEQNELESVLSVLSATTIGNLHLGCFTGNFSVLPIIDRSLNAGPIRSWKKLRLLSSITEEATLQSWEKLKSLTLVGERIDASLQLSPRKFSVLRLNLPNVTFNSVTNQASIDNLKQEPIVKFFGYFEDLEYVFTSQSMLDEIDELGRIYPNGRSNGEFVILNDVCCSNYDQFQKLRHVQRNPDQWRLKSCTRPKGIIKPPVAWFTLLDE